MANRHTNKKLRAAIRARRAATGESHQTALNHLRAPNLVRDSHQPPLNRLRAPSQVREQAKPALPDLIGAHYFGVSVTVAALDLMSQLRLVLVTGAGAPLGAPLGSAFPFRIHTGGLQ